MTKTETRALALLAEQERRKAAIRDLELLGEQAELLEQKILRIHEVHTAFMIGKALEACRIGGADVTLDEMIDIIKHALPVIEKNRAEALKENDREADA